MVRYTVNCKYHSLVDYSHTDYASMRLKILLGTSLRFRVGHRFLRLSRSKAVLYAMNIKSRDSWNSLDCSRINDVLNNAIREGIRCLDQNVN